VDLASIPLSLSYLIFCIYIVNWFNDFAFLKRKTHLFWVLIIDIILFGIMGIITSFISMNLIHIPLGAYGGGALFYGGVIFFVNFLLCLLCVGITAWLYAIKRENPY
jgi:hypothetical protein